MEIEVVDVISIKNGKESREYFQKIPGVVFCKNCGKDYKEADLSNLNNPIACPICKGSAFIEGDFASTLAGYLKLNREDPKALRDYYRSRSRTTSRITMNTKRIIIWLLIMDGFFTPGDKKTEEEIRTTLWKKW